MPQPQITPFLIAPDRSTLAHVSAELRRAGIEPALRLHGERGWAARARGAIAAAERPLLVLVPSARLHRGQLDLTRQVADAGGAVFAWSAAGAHDDSGDDWIIDRLLEQRGAITDDRLAALTLAARILTFAGLGFRPRGVRLAGRSSALADRLRTALEAAGVAPVTSRDAGQAVVTVTAGGAIQLGGAGNRKLTLGDPAIAAAAIALLVVPDPWPANEPDAAPDVEQDVVELIAQPPARLLSETASKRLLAAYGIDSGEERLCNSPTQATRFAARFDGPVVLKLVRPELAGKEESGAVATGVEGGAAVRRAFQSLASLAERLGPPAPLGVLVAEQIDGGARAWIEARVHERFGPLLLVGPGDDRGVPALIALTTPPSLAEALRAVAAAGLAPQPRHARSLARAIQRFGTLVHELKGRITRAEIHPLVAVDGRETAVALDALVGIAG